MQLMKFQENAYQEIMHNLNKNNIVLVCGQLGCGKSQLINKYFKNDYSSFFEFKEIDKNSNDALPLIAVSKAFSDYLNNEKENVDILKDMSGEKLPLTYLINKLSKLIRFSKSMNNYFSDTEINIIFSLNNKLKKVKKGCFYIVFDNSEYVNDFVMTFVRKLTACDIMNDFFKNRLKIIFVENVINEEVNENLHSLLENQINISISHDDYMEYVHSTTDIEGISDETISVLEALSAKDFSITNMLLEYLKTRELILDDLSIRTITVNRLVDVFDKVIVSHMSKHTIEIDCLKVASILGNIISSYDLVELTAKDKDFINTTIQFGKQTGLLKRDSNSTATTSFLHPIIRDILYEKLSDKKRHHQQYNELLKQRYPTKHLLMAENLYNGDIQTKQMRDEFLTQLMIYAKNKSLQDFDARKHIDKYFDETTITRFVNEYYLALLYYSQGDYYESEKLINSISNIDIPSSVTSSLIYYIKARIKTILGDDTEDFVKAKDWLIKCSKTFLENQIYELYFDSLTVLINIYAYKLSDLSSARQIEKDYVDTYQQLNNDVASEFSDEYSEFQRRTASLLDAEGAYNRMLNLFNKCTLKDFLPKYKAYNDMIGYSLYAGEFSKAKEYSLKIQEYIVKNSFYDFPEIYKVVSNRILSDLFNNDINTEKAKVTVKNGIKALRKYENQAGVSKVIKMNLACLYILNSNYNDAEKRLLQLYSTMHKYTNNLYTTCVQSNLSALYLLKEDYSKAHEFNLNVKENLFKWDDNYKTYYIWQNEYMKSLIESKTKLTPFDLFKLDKTHTTSAKTYEFIGRGLMFSELLFYTL